MKNLIIYNGDDYDDYKTAFSEGATYSCAIDAEPTNRIAIGDIFDTAMLCAKMLGHGCPVAGYLNDADEFIALHSIVYPDPLSEKDFIEQVFELAFGDNAINRQFPREEALEKLREYSNKAHSLDEGIDYSPAMYR